MSECRSRMLINLATIGRFKSRLYFSRRGFTGIIKQGRLLRIAYRARFRGDNYARVIRCVEKFFQQRRIIKGYFE